MTPFEQQLRHGATLEINTGLGFLESDAYNIAGTPGVSPGYEWRELMFNKFKDLHKMEIQERNSLHLKYEIQELQERQREQDAIQELIEHEIRDSNIRARLDISRFNISRIQERQRQPEPEQEQVQFRESEANANSERHTSTQSAQSLDTNDFEDPPPGEYQTFGP